MITLKRPMLAGKVDLPNLRYPVYMSGKLDGIRCLGVDGAGLSRTLRPIPNKFVRAWFSDHATHLNGVDGELIVGSPTARNVYSTTYSGVMSEEGTPDFTYFVFDRWDRTESWIVTYLREMPTLAWKMIPRLQIVTHVEVCNECELLGFEDTLLSLGYEGGIIRDPNALYKQGRSTTEEGVLLKLKRFEDAEAVIVGFVELMQNANESTIDARGYTKRSSHKENKIPLSTLGALVVKGLTDFKDIEFEIGYGFDFKMRDYIWQNRATLLGSIVKFKHFPKGVKNAPRHAGFIGFRSKIDI